MTGKILIFALVCLSFVNRASALDTGGVPAPSVKSVVHLNRAPVNKSMLEIHLPRPVTIKLDNGLQIMVLERHSLPTINISLWIESGALSDPKEMPGLAEFTAELLREGTARRTSAQISSEVDALGASLGASSDFGSDISEISASGLSSDFASLMDLTSDIALHPAFPDSELAKYKTRRLATLEEERSDPNFLAREELFKRLYEGSPAAVIAPTKSSIEQAAANKLKEFHERHYLPNNALLGIAGDIKPREAIAMAKKYFGNWKPRLPVPASPEITTSPRPLNICLVDRPGSVQTTILIGDLAVAFKDPDHIPLIIANHILGEGAESRLFLDIREDKGYAYDTSSSVDMTRYPGPWHASADVRNAVTGDALGELLDEFRRLREEKVSAPELADSKRTVVARFALSLESSPALLRRWMFTKYYGMPDDYWDLYPAEAAHVNAATIGRVAKQYLDPLHLQIICVGDAKQILQSIKKYGPVEIYDVNGKPLRRP